MSAIKVLPVLAYTHFFHSSSNLAPQYQSDIVEKHLLSSSAISKSLDYSGESHGHLWSSCEPSPIFILKWKKNRYKDIFKSCSTYIEGKTNEEIDIFCTWGFYLDEPCAAQGGTLSNHEWKSSDCPVYLLDDFECLATKSELPLPIKRKKDLQAVQFSTTKTKHEPDQISKLKRVVEKSGTQINFSNLLMSYGAKSVTGLNKSWKRPSSCQKDLFRLAFIQHCMKLSFKKLKHCLQQDRLKLKHKCAT